MKRPASLLAALLCVMLNAPAAEAQPSDQTASSRLPAAERALNASKVASGLTFEPLPGESQRDLVARARARLDQRPQGTAQAAPSSISGRFWPGAASSPYSPASTRPSSRGVSGFGIFLLLQFALIFLALMKMSKGVSRLVRIVSASAPREEKPLRELDHMFFDQHVAKRLAELQVGGPVEETADGGSGPRPPPPMAAPAAVRRFGRRV